MLPVLRFRIADSASLPLLRLSAAALLVLRLLGFGITSGRLRIGNSYLGPGGSFRCRISKYAVLDQVFVMCVDYACMCIHVFVFSLSLSLSLYIYIYI